MVDDIALWVGRAIVWYFIGVFGLVLVCAPMGAARDLFIKPVKK
jgi:hypothetical protein